MQQQKRSLMFAWMFGVSSGLLPRECNFPHPGGETGGAAGSSSGGASGQGGSSGAAGGAASGGEGGSAGEGGAVTSDSVDPVLGCPAEAWADHATFELLPLRDAEPLPPGNAVQQQFAISADGRFIGGSALIRRADQTYPYAPTIWSQGELTTLAETYGTVSAFDCAGAVAVGSAGAPFWWTPSAGRQLLNGGTAYWVSADGAYFVGVASDNFKILRWGPDRQPQQLGIMSGSFNVTAISADARTLFGEEGSIYCGGPDDICPVGASRWTNERGTERLFDSLGYVIASADGSTVAAAPYHADGAHYESVSLWTEDAPLRELSCPILPCFPRALSSRGHVLLTQGSSPLVWSEKHGFRELAAVLEEYGAATDDYFLDVSAMSEDARVFTGTAWLNGQDRAVGYRATLPRAAWE